MSPVPVAVMFGLKPANFSVCKYLEVVEVVVLTRLTDLEAAVSVIFFGA